MMLPGYLPKTDLSPQAAGTMAPGSTLVSSTRMTTPGRCAVCGSPMSRLHKELSCMFLGCAPVRRV